MKYPTIIYSLIFICSILVVSCDSKKPGQQQSDKKTEEQQKAVKDAIASSESARKEVESGKESQPVSSDTLIGRWLRPDGNYVIQINAIKENKKVDAQYFNPNPINIARAEIIPDTDLRIFIEFNDRGYEGSSYDLKYDLQNDALVGNYFQATYGQTYQIGFVRLEE